MSSTMYTETPGTDDRPEELPEGERPEELPQTPPQETPENPEVEPGNVGPEVEPLTEPESPEIGNPSPGPGPDEPSADLAWRQRLRHREIREPSERSTRVA